MKKLLLIGDSIRMNYDRCVREALEGRAQVLTPDENARFAAYTYYAIGDWENRLRFGEDVAVIHWNVGLHDAARLHYDEPVTPPEIYGYYLGRIIRRLRDVYPNARQIFALTTPVWEEKYVLPWLVRKNSDIDELNRTAREVMEENGIPVNDLPAALRGYAPEEIYADATHFNHTGSAALAKAVLGAVCPALGAEPDLTKIRPAEETRKDILRQAAES